MAEIPAQSISVSISGPREYRVEQCGFQRDRISASNFKELKLDVPLSCDALYTLEDGDHVLVCDAKAAMFCVYSLAAGEVVSTMVVQEMLQCYSVSSSPLKYFHLNIATPSAVHVYKLAPETSYGFEELISVEKRYACTACTSSDHYLAFTTRTGRHHALTVYSVNSYRYTTRPLAHRVKCLTMDQRDSFQFVLVTKVERGRYLFSRYRVSGAASAGGMSPRSPTGAAVPGLDLCLIDSIHDVSGPEADKKSIPYPHRNYCQIRGLIAEGHLDRYVVSDLRLGSGSRQLLLHAHFSRTPRAEYLAADASINGEFLVTVAPSQQALDIYFNMRYSFSVAGLDAVIDPACKKEKLRDRVVSVALVPRTYELLVATEKGHIFRHPGLVQVSSTTTLPATVFASDRKRRNHVFLYDDHIEVFSVAFEGPRFSPLPSWADLYRCAHAPEGWVFSVTHCPLANFTVSPEKQVLTIDFRLAAFCPECAREGRNAGEGQGPVVTVELPLFGTLQDALPQAPEQPAIATAAPTGQETPRATEPAAAASPETQQRLDAMASLMRSFDVGEASAHTSPEPSPEPDEEDSASADDFQVEEDPRELEEAVKLASVASSNVASPALKARSPLIRSTTKAHPLLQADTPTSYLTGPDVMVTPATAGPTSPLSPGAELSTPSVMQAAGVPVPAEPAGLTGEELSGSVLNGETPCAVPRGVQGAPAEADGSRRKTFLPAEIRQNASAIVDEIVQETEEEKEIRNRRRAVLAGLSLAATAIGSWLLN